MRHTVAEVELKNGARGLLVDVPGATVTSYELNFRAGDYLAPSRKKWETPHIMEHVILGANEEFPDTQAFQAEINRNGASTNAYTSYYQIGYVGEVADFEWDRVLQLQLTALSKPLFLDGEFRAELNNIRDELVSHGNQHFWQLFGSMNKTFGFTHPTDKERAKLVDNVERTDIINHFKNTHYTRNLRFIVAGSLRGRRAEVKKVLESVELPKGNTRFKLPVEHARKPSAPTFIANKTVDNLYLTIASYLNSVISVAEEDAFRIARIMLTDTLYSKILGQAREKGLVYSVNSSLGINSQHSEWSFSTQVLPENASALCDIVLREIKKVQNGIIEDHDIERAKQHALGSFQRSYQTVGNIARSYSRYFFDGYIEDMRAVPDRIRQVSKQDVAKVMSKMFEQRIGNVGILGGTDASIPDKLYEQLQPLWK